ncbi:MAG: GntR family transcriptional regulator [Hyphomicrobiaceae bacterium]|nr:GntR family transcriptional regulator [Hyphomicrobiaceae bacterium]
MMHEPKFTSQPLYVQLREALMKRIASGDWRPGAAIPNEIDIAREYGLSAGTVRKALDWMEQANLVVRQQGRGTFVCDPSTAELANRFENIWGPEGNRIVAAFGEAKVTVSEADAYACDRLRLKPGAKIHRVEQLRTLHDRPFMLEIVALPVTLFSSVPETGYTLTGAAGASSVLLGNAEEHLRVDTARGDVARQLDVAEGTPVLRLDRVVFTLDGRPAEWRIGYCLMGENSYRCSIGSL